MDDATLPKMVEHYGARNYVIRGLRIGLSPEGWSLWFGAEQDNDVNFVRHHLLMYPIASPPYPDPPTMTLKTSDRGKRYLELLEVYHALKKDSDD